MLLIIDNVQFMQQNTTLLSVLKSSSLQNWEAFQGLMHVESVKQV